MVEFTEIKMLLVEYIGNDESSLIKIRDIRKFIDAYMDTIIMPRKLIIDDIDKKVDKLLHKKQLKKRLVIRWRKKPKE